MFYVLHCAQESRGFKVNKGRILFVYEQTSPISLETSARRLRIYSNVYIHVQNTLKNLYIYFYFNCNDTITKHKIYKLGTIHYLQGLQFNTEKVTLKNKE